MNNKKGDFIFGKYSINVVLVAVNDVKWQYYRASMTGTPTDAKFIALKRWLILNSYSEKSKIQVTNYINAMKRGGLITERGNYLVIVR